MLCEGARDMYDSGFHISRFQPNGGKTKATALEKAKSRYLPVFEKVGIASWGYIMVASAFYNASYGINTKLLRFMYTSVVCSSP